MENMEIIKFNNVFKNKKILITGHTGFKGSWLTTWLLNLGADVYGISKDIPTNPSLFEALNLKNQITDYIIDIRNYEEIFKTINIIKPDFVFHLAAQAIVSESYKNPLETITTNPLGTVNILEALRNVNHKCTAIIITSDKCYFNIEWAWGYKETDRLGGKDIYSSSKAAAEILINSYFHSFFNNENSNVKIATARAGNVIGGGDWAVNRIIPDCIKAWNNNQTVEIRSPEATRPWQHVLEPLSGYLLLAEKLFSINELNGESFNFGPNSSNSYTVIKLIEDLSKSWEINKELKPYKITDNIKFHEAGLLKLNCDKSLMYLKWLPTLNYNQTVEFTGSWYANYYKTKNDVLEFTLNQIKNYENLASQNNSQWLSIV